MEAKKNQSLLVVSLDVQPTTGQLSIAYHRDLRKVASNLAKLVERYRMPATWALDDPGDDVAKSLADNSSGHEIAIHGKSVWPTGTPSRSNLANDLRRRMDRAQQNGVSISSLVGVDIDDPDTDLLVKNQISVLRTPLSKWNRCWVQPEPVRFGVWNLSASCHFPGTKTWLSEITKQKFHRLVRTAAARKKILHMVVDVNRMLNSESSHLKALEGVFSCANDYRNAGQLQIANLQGSISNIFRRPSLRPAKSILRSA